MTRLSADKLVGEYLARKSRNERYSERAFAKAVGLSPGFLKLYFQGKRGLSLAKAKEVCDRLGWSDQEAGNFLNSIECDRRARKGGDPGYKVESFFEISDWYHFAIVEILKTKKNISAEEIARRFGLSVMEVEFSLRALLRAGLVAKKKSGYVAVDDYIVPAISSSAIRKFHTQMLGKAQHAIAEQPMEAREMRSLTFAFDPAEKAAAAAMIKEFMQKFEKKFSGRKSKKVYQLSLAFFNLERESN
jgi:predicted transcriptional regulator